MTRLAVPESVRPIEGFPVVTCRSYGAAAQYYEGTARATVLTTQLAWWQHVVGAVGAYTLHWRESWMYGAPSEEVSMGLCRGRPLPAPVTEITVYDGATRRRAILRNNVWILADTLPGEGDKGGGL